MCDSDIDKLGMLIDTNSSVNTVVLIYNFREGDRRVPTIYRANFPWATVLPKMHILEDHTIPWLRRHHVGAGLMGGQGAESIHAHLMRLKRIHQGIASDVDRLKYILKEHELESAPSLTCLRPPPAKRQKKMRALMSTVSYIYVMSSLLCIPVKLCRSYHILRAYLKHKKK